MKYLLRGFEKKDYLLPRNKNCSFYIVSYKLTNKFKSYSFCTYPVLQDILDIILYNKGNLSNYFLSNSLKMYFKIFLHFFLKHKIQNNWIKTIFWQLHTWLWFYRRTKLALKFSILITVKCDHFGTEESWSHYPNQNNIWIKSIPI
jgi:hypothetical protein